MNNITKLETYDNKIADLKYDLNSATKNKAELVAHLKDKIYSDMRWGYEKDLRKQCEVAVYYLFNKHIHWFSDVDFKYDENKNVLRAWLKEEFDRTYGGTQVQMVQLKHIKEIFPFDALFIDQFKSSKRITSLDEYKANVLKNTTPEQMLELMMRHDTYRYMTYHINCKELKLVDLIMVLKPKYGHRSHNY